MQEELFFGGKQGRQSRFEWKPANTTVTVFGYRSIIIDNSSHHEYIVQDRK